MTGYGLAKIKCPSASLEVGIRTINGRYLELRFHIPKEYMAFEGELRKAAEAFFQRGTVDIFISRFPNTQKMATQVQLNRSLARQYHQSLKSLSKELKIEGQLSLESLARLPEVFKVEESKEVGKEEGQTLLKAFKQACKLCNEERQREGKSLQAELLSHLTELEKCVLQMTELRSEVNQQLTEKLEQKIQARLQQLELDPHRIAQEVAILMEKSDINEEIARLLEHLKSYRSIVKSTNAKGKRLDFYTQELLREVNTVGSKSTVFKLTQLVVEAKTTVERLREQVQNIE